MIINRIKTLLATAAFAVPLLAVVPVRAATVTQFDFTSAELSNNWGPERIAPSGGFSSLATYQGRTNVAEIRINSSLASSNASLEHPYYWTEGIKTSKG